MDWTQVPADSLLEPNINMVCELAMAQAVFILSFTYDDIAQ